MFCGTTVQKLRRQLKRNPQKGMLDELLGVWKYCKTLSEITRIQTEVEYV